MRERIWYAYMDDNFDEEEKKATIGTSIGFSGKDEARKKNSR
jgi:hypothetical protein